MRFFRALVPAALAVAASLASTRPAEACSAGPCSTGSYVPASGTVPASLPALLWTPRAGLKAPDPTAVGLFKVTSGGEVAVTVTSEQQPTGAVLVRPAAPLDPDSDYVLRGGNTCEGSGMVDATATQTSFHTGAAAPYPVSPGTLVLGTPTVGSLQVTTISGECFSVVTAAQATISLTPSADVVPWQDAVQYTVLVDGQEWRKYGELLGDPPPAGHTFGMVYSTCDQGNDKGTDLGVAPGKHTVSIKATVPGWGMSVETAKVEVTLSCPVAGGGTGGGGTGGGGTGATSGGGSQGGGGCNVTGQGAGDLWPIAGLAALAVARRRRRDRR